MEAFERERYFAARLQGLRRICTVLAGTALGIGIAGWFLVEGFQVRPFDGLPKAVPISLTFFAAIVILLASRLRTGLLRLGLPSHRSLSLDPNDILAAYRRATLVSFALLEAAALIGLMVAMVSGSSFYGLVLCLASLLSMLIRWPNAETLDRLARGRVSP